MTSCGYSNRTREVLKRLRSYFHDKKEFTLTPERCYFKLGAMKTEPSLEPIRYI